MKKILLLGLILLIIPFAFAQKKEVGQPTPYSALPFSLKNYVRDWLSPVVIYAINGKLVKVIEVFPRGRGYRF